MPTSRLQRSASTRQRDPMTSGGDHLGADHLASAGELLSQRQLSTGTANDGAISLVEYFNELGDSGTRRGFFKADSPDASLDPFDGISSYDRVYDSESDRMLPGENQGRSPHLAARAVASSRVDRMLGTNVLSQDSFATLNGQTGVVSSAVQGLQVRQDKAKADGVSSAFLDADYSGAEAQRSLADIQLNDFLTGQADRHMGNLFFDPKTGSFKAIDNDLSFADQINPTLMPDYAGFHSGKQITNLPDQIDADTAERVLGVDVGEYVEMLQGRAEDPEQLDLDEVIAAAERMEMLQEHIRNIQETGEGGALVREWGEDTLARATSEEAPGSLMKDLMEKLEANRSMGDNADHSQPVGTRPLDMDAYEAQQRADSKAERKHNDKRFKSARKAQRKQAKADAKAAKRSRKAQRKADKKAAKAQRKQDKRARKAASKAELKQRQGGRDLDAIKAATGMFGG